MAYRNFATAEAVCFPLPFNWLVRWLRQAYWWLVWPGENGIEKAFGKGLSAGKAQMYERANNMEAEAYERGKADGEAITLAALEALGQRRN